MKPPIVEKVSPASWSPPPLQHPSPADTRIAGRGFWIFLKTKFVKNIKLPLRWSGHVKQAVLATQRPPQISLLSTASSSGSCYTLLSPALISSGSQPTWDTLQFSTPSEHQGWLKSPLLSQPLYPGRPASLLSRPRCSLKGCQSWRRSPFKTWRMMPSWQSWERSGHSSSSSMSKALLEWLTRDCSASHQSQVCKFWMYIAPRSVLEPYPGCDQRLVLL